MKILRKKDARINFNKIVRDIVSRSDKARYKKYNLTAKL